MIELLPENYPACIAAFFNPFCRAVAIGIAHKKALT
jgi:hypothetical protein